MAETTTVKSLADGQASIMLVLAAIAGFGLFSYSSIDSWKSSDAVIDYQIALKMTQDIWSDTSRFVDDTSRWGVISATSKVLSIVGGDAEYSRQVLNASSKSDLKDVIRALKDNAIILRKYENIIAQYNLMLKRNDISIGARNRIQAQAELMKVKEMKYREQHNELYSFIMDKLAALQKKAMMIYMLYLLPYFLVVILLARFLIRKTSGDDKPVAKDTSLEKVTLITPNLSVNVKNEKPAFSTATRPPLAKGWKASKFGKDAMAIWKEAGYKVPVLAENILAYLYANKNVPASIGGHNCYPGGLLDHTINVMKQALEYNKKNNWGNFRGELLLLSAMAHDIGKCETFFYDKNTDAWYDNGSFHDKESGWLLQSMPGFSIMDIDQRMSLLMSVKNRHDRDSIPNNYPKFSVLLFKALSKIDDIASTNEVEQVSHVTDKAAPLVIGLWEEVITSLNINGYRDGRIDGYYDSRQNILVVPEPRLTAAIIRQLPEKFRVKIPFAASTDAMHPMWKSVHQLLFENSCIVKDVVFVVGTESISVQANDYGFISLFAYADLIKNGVAINIENISDIWLEKWNVVELSKLKMKPAKIAKKGSE